MLKGWIVEEKQLGEKERSREVVVSLDGRLAVGASLVFILRPGNRS